MSLTNEQIEAVARRTCELLDLDPDETIRPTDKPHRWQQMAESIGVTAAHLKALKEVAGIDPFTESTGIPVAAMPEVVAEPVETQESESNKE